MRPARCHPPRLFPPVWARFGTTNPADSGTGTLRSPWDDSSSPTTCHKTPRGLLNRSIAPAAIQPNQNRFLGSPGAILCLLYFFVSPKQSCPSQHMACTLPPLNPIAQKSRSTGQDNGRSRSGRHRKWLPKAPDTSCLLARQIRNEKRSDSGRFASQRTGFLRVAFGSGTRPGCQAPQRRPQPEPRGLRQMPWRMESLSP